MDLADSEKESKDFKRPGHIFPLIAKNGGVIERKGHTEAAVDNPANKRSELILSTKFAFEFKVKAEEIIREVVSSTLKDLKPIELMELNRMLSVISI